jgi:hypothetical protein
MGFLRKKVQTIQGQGIDLVKISRLSIQQRLTGEFDSAE